MNRTIRLHLEALEELYSQLQEEGINIYQNETEALAAEAKAEAEEQAKKAQAKSQFVPGKRDMNTTAKPDPYAAFKKKHDLK